MNAIGAGRLDKVLYRQFVVEFSGLGFRHSGSPVRRSPELTQPTKFGSEFYGNRAYPAVRCFVPV